MNAKTRQASEFKCILIRLQFEYSLNLIIGISSVDTGT